MEAIAKGDSRIRNYFDTFGFVVVRNALDKDEFKKLLTEYDDQYTARTGRVSVRAMLWNRLGLTPGPKKYGFKIILKAILRPDGMRFLPDFVDSSEKFMNTFFAERMQKLYRYFAGDDFLYLGSDGSHFITTSFPWHRDWFTKMPVLKFNFYFNPLPFVGGKFMVIPGSNYTEDSYARFLQKSIAWPMQNKIPGGMSENEFLPVLRNPRRSVGDSIKAWIKDVLGLQKDMPQVPHVSLNVSKGDVIIFDQRMIHCVAPTWPQFSRRLLTMLFSKNAYAFSDDHFLLKQGYTREALMTEIVDLVVSERNHINCPAYGDAMYNHPFSKSKNFITVEKQVTNTDSDTSRYNVGSFPLPDGKAFVSKLNVQRYAGIGADYRKNFSNDDGAGDKLSAAYTYGDVHMGVNAQNIRKVSNA
jgi:ectoine hydroxylase-related dioxygenase (phytanoyl-CoA dioxygenase family)